MTLIDLLHIEKVSIDEERVVLSMPVASELLQPFGYLHGGATVSLLETAASYGAQEHADFDKERPFGLEVCVRHRKSVSAGTLLGVASLDRREGGKLFWKVRAYDDEGAVISEGTVVTKAVSLERLAEKERAQRQKQILNDQIKDGSRQ